MLTCAQMTFFATYREAVKDRKFSERSDVWAFGITCIEVWLVGGGWQLDVDSFTKCARENKCTISFKC